MEGLQIHGHPDARHPDRRHRRLGRRRDRRIRSRWCGLRNRPQREERQEAAATSSPNYSANARQVGGRSQPLPTRRRAVKRGRLRQQQGAARRDPRLGPRARVTRSPTAAGSPPPWCRPSRTPTDRPPSSSAGDPCDHALTASAPAVGCFVRAIRGLDPARSGLVQTGLAPLFALGVAVSGGREPVLTVVKRGGRVRWTTADLQLDRPRRCPSVTESVPARNV